MSSERTANPSRPLKPTLASTRTARTPITPRVAGNATPPSKSTGSRPTPTIRSEPATPRAKQTATPVKEVLGNGNVTPRSSARMSRTGSANSSPRQAESTSSSRQPRQAVFVSGISSERNETVGGLGIVAGPQNNAGPLRPNNFVGDNGNAQSPLQRSPGFFELSPRSTEETIDSRFFHASDAQKQEPKKTQFFHADGRQERNQLSSTTQSPVLSAISEQRPIAAWIRSESISQPSRSPPLRSPALSSVSATPPVFSPLALQPGRPTSPSQSKENIHLSYRKGVSQIFGTRPTPVAQSNNSDRDADSASDTRQRDGDFEPPPRGLARYHKSPSLSSIDSSTSLEPRQRSVASSEPVQQPSIIPEVKSATVPRTAKALQDLPSIDTSLESPGILSRTESGLSPTKATSDLAAEARRERKVLDLEISNSSLMAINTSLEREVRRQKAELKRFRRLSRAGRLSFAPGERMRTISDDLSALPEEEEDEDYFGLAVESSNVNDEYSDDEESIASSAEPSAFSAYDRLAKDEKRLQFDLEKHRELLSQSQAMNQSIKRCMYATEDMITEGKKALDYHVRVSDVKLGGRVLSNHDDGEGAQEIEVVDDMVEGDTVIQVKDFLEAWTAIGRRSHEGSEFGDRDSGIEVDRPTNPSLPLAQKVGIALDSGRPPGFRDSERFGSFS